MISTLMTNILVWITIAFEFKFDSDTSGSDYSEGNFTLTSNGKLNMYKYVIEVLLMPNNYIL